MSGATRDVVGTARQAGACMTRRPFNTSKENGVIRMFAVVWVLLTLAAPAPAQDALLDVRDEWARVIDKARAVAPVGDDLFGDSTSYYSGETTFAVTDVSLSGNSTLPVAVARTHSTAPPQGPTAPGLFGEWELDVPHLHGVFARGAGWQVAGPTPDARCSATLQVQPPSASNGPGIFAGFDYWSGNSLYVPGAGDQPMLVPAANNTRHPLDGNTYPWTTNGRWWLRCLASTANGVAGEAFVAHGPDGTQYRFDWVVTRPYSTLSRNTSSGAVHLLLRDEVRIYPTRIQDRHGNWVNYTWSGAQLQRIDANDGRSLVLTYNDGGRIASVSDGSRVWRYTYASNNRPGLIRVDLPDGSAWTLNTTANIITYQSRQFTLCDDPGIVNTPVNTYTFTHPSGATGVFEFTPVRHGRSQVTPRCKSPRPDDPDGIPEYGAPKIFDTFALVRKTLSGPGLSAQTWTVAYGPANDSYAGCSTCATTKTVEVTGPGDYARYTFGNAFYRSEGKLLKTERGSGPGAILSVEDSSYLFDPVAPAYLPFVGFTGRTYEDAASAQWIFPLQSTAISQQGVTFTRAINSFDEYANPVSVTRSSTLGFSATETTSYHHDLALWVLGQVASVTDVATGKKTSETDYDPRALPFAVKSFGLLRQTLTYHPDGTVATVGDGNGHTTTASGWKRGIPQSITFADTSTRSAVVDDLGQITSTTDELGTVTSYTYDAMGRLASLSLPGWTPTSFSFVPVPSDEFGLSDGHWRHTETTGAYKKTTYYDGRFRPLLTLEEDTANPATRRYTTRTFDHDNRETFASYPEANATSVTSLSQGTHTSYDALGRVTSTSQDAELGVPLTTSTTYLAGFQTRTTNPRGQVTTVGFQAYDTPDTSAPVAILGPDGVTTSIVRDGFGMPLSVARSGLYAGSPVSATRRYVYDAFERLCKRIEPEAGGTLFEYDGAGNLTGSAEGQSASLSCDPIPAAARTTRSYDARDRLLSVSYPNAPATPATVYSYYADGALATLTQGDSAWSYDYNNRRLLKNETLNFGASYVFSYDYNPLGHLTASHTPSGLSIDYAPNALGQATRAGSFASGATYFPDGSLKQFTYGNGLIRSVTQNGRHLPSRVRDALGTQVVHDFSYGYDQNGNVTTITDADQAGLQTRSMQYDARDRLTRATAMNLWGTTLYTYDPLDNLRSNDQETRKYRYQYDANNRLTQITDPTGTALPGLDFAYDAQGRQTRKGTQTRTFDGANRITAINGETYAYDGSGRRIATWGADGRTKVEVYTQSGQLGFAVDSRKGGGSSFIYLAGQRIAEDHWNCATNIHTPTYYHSDALGSPVATTDANRSVLERSYYAPYGEALNRTVDGPGYTGHMMDAATGLVYAQQRYYDPTIGKFLSIDPVAANANTGGNFNRYWYANNNPYKNIDPDGRYIEAAFEALSLTLGIKSAGDNFSQRNYLAGTVDTVGVVIDAVLTAVPIAPGTVGLGIQAVRAGDSTADAALTANRIGDDALVARGGSAEGANSVDGILGGTGTHPEGVTGFSVESANGASLCELCTNIPNNQVGVTTAGQIRAAGGDVVATGGRSPNHATVTGLAPEQASGLLTPTQANPVPKTERTQWD